MVESFVGAIALGYLLAQCILHFVNIFASPVGVWFVRDEFRAIVPHTTGSARGLLGAALPEFVTFFLLLLVWYLLLRWLYFTPLKKETSEQATSS